jgi:hypothetical protein
MHDLFSGSMTCADHIIQELLDKYEVEIKMKQLGKFRIPYATKHTLISSGITI